MDAARADAYKTMSVYDDYSWEDTWEQYGSDSQKAYYGKYGEYLRTMQDLRRGFELMQDYKTSEPGSIQTSRQDENLFEGSKWLRQTVNGWGYLGYKRRGRARGPWALPPRRCRPTAWRATGGCPPTTQSISTSEVPREEEAV